jgi:hypothetical protein
MATRSATRWTPALLVIRPAAREHAQVRVDVLGELLHVVRALVAADGELLPGDLDLDRSFHSA